ncbi:MAG: ferrous iron transporter B [Spirochaetaceae bacterium]|jgi:ferrous iron transport protein B|nr:ferrous iron transporter B [Spirochaetaceae bacterium]
MTIALAGNPNAGKTTLFNALTGSNQFVGNWPGVTVEKKEGKLKTQKDVNVMDLPGVYSLSPYSLEEVITRNFLLEEKPEVILNLIDGTNIERNLFLTTQLLELGIPVLAAVNMIDEVEKAGDFIDLKALETALGCPLVPISALKGTGIPGLIEKAVALGGEKTRPAPKVPFSKPLEAGISSLSDLLQEIPEGQKRFYALKILEKDEKISLPLQKKEKFEEIRKQTEAACGDDIESLIAEDRYRFITALAEKCIRKKNRGGETLSDRIDRVVTNRVLALPIFAAVIFLIYFISVTSIGTWVTDWTNDGLFGEGFHLFGLGGRAFAEAAETGDPNPEDFGVWIPGLPVLIGRLLEAGGVSEWLSSLILDGIVAGVGAVLGFVPQMLVLFLLLALVESCGYMARIAFILDRLFRRFGLSGKSFIPMLVGTGCGVPGVMASRTIENPGDRRLTVMTTTFMPCGAKLPVIAMISGAVFGGAWWVAPSAYFIGIASVIMSGIILKKTRPFLGEVSPFVMELPPYRVPGGVNVLRAMWERSSSFIKKAGSIILLSAVLIWFLSNFGFTGEGFQRVDDMNDGLLAGIGSGIAILFAPLGFGTWDAAVATITGLIAKENVVGTMGVLYGFAEVSEEGEEMWSAFGAHFTALSGYAFLLFNLYCPPCFAAIGAIRREMNNPKWTLAAVGYQLGWGYLLALIVYQFGSFFTGQGFGLGTVAGILGLAFLVWLLVRRPSEGSALPAEPSEAAA